MSVRLLLASLFSVAALGGCGGGGGGTATLAPPPAAPAPAPAPATGPGPAVVTGEASAPFLPGANPAKIFYELGGFSVGKLSTFTQVQGGAVTSIDGVTLGSPATVRDIAGDATFALGRWAAGTLSDSKVTLSESSNASYHYAMFNAPASVPSSGTLACDAGTFTTPTYEGGTSVGVSDFRGRVSGTAQVTFSSQGSAVTVNLSVSNSAGSGANTFSTVVPAGYATAFAGHSLGTGSPEATVGIGVSAGGYDVLGGYEAKTDSGAMYMGAFRFHCK